MCFEGPLRTRVLFDLTSCLDYVEANTKPGFREKSPQNFYAFQAWFGGCYDIFDLNLVRLSWMSSSLSHGARFRMFCRNWQEIEYFRVSLID